MAIRFDQRTNIIWEQYGTKTLKCNIILHKILNFKILIYVTCKIIK